MEAVLVERALPAPLGFFFQRVEPLGDVVGGGAALLCVSGHALIEHSGDRSLLDPLAVITAVQARQDAANQSRVLGEFAQIGAGTLFAGSKPQHRVLEPRGDE